MSRRLTALVFVLVAGPLAVTAFGAEAETFSAEQTAPDVGALSLLPPLLAIGLAIAWRQVHAALFLGILFGAIVLSPTDPVAAFTATMQEFVVAQVADAGHAHVILFTLFLGCMVGVMSSSGGTAALVRLLTPLSSTRERTQLTTVGLGTVVFFDDYANTLLVGGTMRPVADRQGVSREKLAFLVDATAAPIAGLAIVSTWVGVELEAIGKAYAEVGLEGDPYATFLATLPYRFYPLLMLAFVVAVAWSGRDFGPMRVAEQVASVDVPDPDATKDDNTLDDGSLWCALVPLVTLIASLSVGFVWSGIAGLDEGEPMTLATVLAASDSYAVLLAASFLGSVSAVVTAVVTRRGTLDEAMQGWVDGMQRMLPALVVLVLAWGIAAVCDKEHLNTAGFLVSVAEGRVAAGWMPTLAFVLSAGVSFATGSSWSTMQLVIPLIVPTAFHLLGGDGVSPNDPILLGTVGGVLAGAIFGDHCSPISDTTVLSSAATGCDHLRHVATQLPYACVVGGLAIACGTVPAAFGLSPYVGLGLGTVAIVGVVVFAGSSPRGAT